MTQVEVQNQYKKFFDLERIIANIKEYLPDFDEKLFREAYVFTEKAHRGQMRKDNETPYLIHPIKTVETLVNLRADQETILSALLHDVPEDTRYDIHEIKQKFGEQIAFLVDGITKLSKVHYQYNMPERQVESLKKLFLHSAKDPRVILIKLADRLHNMETLEYVTDPGKRMRIARETLEIYVPIANLLGIQEMKAQLETYCFRHLFPTEYLQLTQRLESFDKKHRQALAKFIALIKESLEEAKVSAEIQGRQKGLYSIYKKILSQGKSIEDIDDRMGARIIVDSIPECYEVLGIVHSKFVPKPNRFKDYIASPKINGYQSLHTAVFGANGIVTEVQIRTKKMHLEAEYGIAAHFFYKAAQNQTPDESHMTLDKRSSWVKRILEMEKAYKENSEDFLENLRVDVFQDRIFVFSPKGATIDLPKDASVIDFSYAIHTEIGNHAQKAEINGELKPITTPLKTGDTVRIITSSDVTPELFWLSFAKTNLARNKIRMYLKKSSRDKKMKEGKKIMQKAFDLAGMGLFEDISFKKIKRVLSRDLGVTYNNMVELLVDIGEGLVKPTSIIKSLNTNPKGLPFKNTFFRRFLRRTSKDGIDITLRVLTECKAGSLKAIIDVFYRNRIPIMGIKTWSDLQNAVDHFMFNLKLPDLDMLDRIFNELERLDGVIEVQRILYRNFFYFSVVSAILLWLFYPLTLDYLIEQKHLSVEGFWTGLFSYLCLFWLFFTLLYLAKQTKKFFPMERHKKRLWLVAMGILTIAVISLFVELIYFEIHLNWLIIFGGVLIMYIYMGTWFLRTRRTGI